jgi:hypothetical protein
VPLFTLPGLCLALFAAAVVLPRLAGAASTATPAYLPSPSLVFSEVYAPANSEPSTQWFEIHNTNQKAQIPLNGLILATARNQVTLSTTQVITGGGYTLFVFAPDAITNGNILPAPPKTAQVIAVPELGGLDPNADALILSPPIPGTGNLVIDEVNWGTPDQNWVNYNPDSLWKSGLDTLEPQADGKIRTWGRTPADHDTDSPSDWTLHETASPGGRVPPPAGQTVFLNEWTNIAGGLSSLLLWLAFLIIAIIAYRFERLRDTRTYWQLLLLAPSGILFYTVIVIIGFGHPGAALTNDEKWLSFPVLAISAVFCLIAVGIFRSVARSLLEGE